MVVTNDLLAEVHETRPRWLVAVRADTLEVVSNPIGQTIPDDFWIKLYRRIYQASKRKQHTVEKEDTAHMAQQAQPDQPENAAPTTPIFDTL